MAVRGLEKMRLDQIERMEKMIKMRDQVIRDIAAQIEKERLDGKIHDSTAERLNAIAAGVSD